jgi:hypothetical protein
MYTSLEGSEVKEKIEKRFVPVFPFLYKDLGSGKRIYGAEFYLPRPPMNPIPLPTR